MKKLKILKNSRPIGQRVYDPNTFQTGTVTLVNVGIISIADHAVCWDHCPDCVGGYGDEAWGWTRLKEITSEVEEMLAGVLLAT